jgi:hypothetical protein
MMPTFYVKDSILGSLTGLGGWGVGGWVVGGLEILLLLESPSLLWALING